MVRSGLGGFLHLGEWGGMGGGDVCVCVDGCVGGLCDFVVTHTHTHTHAHTHTHTHTHSHTHTHTHTHMSSNRTLNSPAEIEITISAGRILNRVSLSVSVSRCLSDVSNMAT